MGKNLVHKIIQRHIFKDESCVNGRELLVGEEIGIKIDQTLTQDATGTMAYLQFEAMNIPKVKTRLSVSYVDHNTLQTGFENFDDHLFLQSVAKKFGIYFSKAGNGICHQVHLERFSVPGETLLGSDSHTPTCGGAGMLAIGAGGLDVAVALGGGAYYFTMPKVVRINLTGKLNDWVTAKDIILEILRRLSVKGGVGKIFEYGGEGVKTLTVPERATICNMGAELGATTSIFPSDEQTLRYFQAQGRERFFSEQLPDKDAVYDEELTINLGELESLIACPHSPDNVKKVKDLSGTKVQQVIIGSCTNSSYMDLMSVANILKGKKVHPEVSFVVAPGSRQVLEMISENGALSSILSSGARVIESACGPCIGMGQAPPTKGISIRSFNRNFEGRSGTSDAQIYLASPEMCAIAALAGELRLPEKSQNFIRFNLPDKYTIDDSMILSPSQESSTVEIVRGPNIKPLPIRGAIQENLSGDVIIKVGDNVTTDHIMPAGAKLLPLRSNIPALAEYVFSSVDKDFSARAREKNGGFIIGGENYGQGSSREHAALCPMFLGVKAVIAQSFARIHRNNLINFGILPLAFVNKEDYNIFDINDKLEIKGIRAILKSDDFILQIKNSTKNKTISVKLEATQRERRILFEGGLLNATKLLDEEMKITA